MIVLVTEGLLQEFLLKREFAAPEPSPSDVESYFQANQDRYGKPETAEVLLVQFEPDEDVQAVLDKIKTADDFRAWFEERQKANAQTAGKTTLRLTSQPVFVRGIRADALCTRPPSPRPCYAPDPTTPQEALHLWLQAVARPGEPYPPYAEVARQKLALETAPGRTEALALRVHNWIDQDANVELTLDLPPGWEADGWRGGTLVVPAGEAATVDLTLRVGPLEAGIEASVGAELWQDGVRRDRVRVYYRTV